METCSKCGKRGEPLRGVLRGAVIRPGTVDVFRETIMKCPKCSKLFCGGCAGVSNSYGDTTYECPSCRVSVEPP